MYSNKSIQSFVETLKTLCLQPGISGNEIFSGISSHIFEILRKINPDTKIDKFGNVISIFGSGSKRVILDAHLDEVGFIVSRRKENIWLCPIGDIRIANIHGSNGYILSRNINGKILYEEDSLVFEPDNLNDKKNVKTGDLVSFKRSFNYRGVEIGATALDNRVGCSVVIELMKKIKVPADLTIVTVFSVQEEKDSATLNTIAMDYRIDFGLIIDAAYANPVDFDSKDMNIPELGKGCAIQYLGKDFIVEHRTIRKIEKLASSNSIPIQKEIPSPDLGRTNFPMIQKGGVLCGVVNIPVRYQHREISETNIEDALSAIDLLSLIVKNFQIFTID